MVDEAKSSSMMDDEVVGDGAVDIGGNSSVKSESELEGVLPQLQLRGVRARGVLCDLLYHDATRGCVGVRDERQHLRRHHVPNVLNRTALRYLNLAEKGSPAW